MSVICENKKPIMLQYSAYSSVMWKHTLRMNLHQQLYEKESFHIYWIFKWRHNLLCCNYIPHLLPKYSFLHSVKKGNTSILNFSPVIASDVAQEQTEMCPYVYLSFSVRLQEVPIFLIYMISDNHIWQQFWRAKFNSPLKLCKSAQKTALYCTELKVTTWLSHSPDLKCNSAEPILAT